MNALHLGESLSLFLVDVAAKATLLLVVALLATWILRRSSAAVRHRVWGLTMGSLVLLPALSWMLPTWRLPILPAGTGPDANRAAAIVKKKKKKKRGGGDFPPNNTVHLFEQDDNNHNCRRHARTTASPSLLRTIRPPSPHQWPPQTRDRCHRSTCSRSR